MESRDELIDVTQNNICVNCRSQFGFIIRGTVYTIGVLILAEGLSSGGYSVSNGELLISIPANVVNAGTTPLVINCFFPNPFIIDSTLRLYSDGE